MKKENDKNKNKSIDKPKTNNTVDKITGKINNGEKYNPNILKVEKYPLSNEPKKLTLADFISSKKPTNKNDILK